MDQYTASEAAKVIWNSAISAFQAVERGDVKRVRELSETIESANEALRRFDNVG
jgi:hypothetical protein